MDLIAAVLSIQQLIERISAYAGLGAFAGLALLTLLYFAQAREVKRLREWAGRGPENAFENERNATEQVQFGHRVKNVQRIARPPAPAMQMGGAAGTVVKPPPGAISDELEEGVVSAQGVDSNEDELTQVHNVDTESEETPDETSHEEVSPSDEENQQDAGQSPHGASPGQPGENQQRNVAPPLRPDVYNQPPTSKRHASRSSRRRHIRSRARRGRTAALAAAGILAVTGVSAFAFSRFTGGESVSSPNAAAPTTPAAQRAAHKPPIARGRTTVAVLNGTTVSGLANEVASTLVRSGFKEGSVANATNQQLPETVVNYAPRYKRAAEEVAKVLNVNKVQSIDADTQAVAGMDAMVVVVVGADRT